MEIRTLKSRTPVSYTVSAKMYLIPLSRRIYVSLPAYKRERRRPVKFNTVSQTSLNPTPPRKNDASRSRFFSRKASNLDITSTSEPQAVFSKWPQQGFKRFRHEILNLCSGTMHSERKNLLINRAIIIILLIYFFAKVCTVGISSSIPHEWNILQMFANIPKANYEAYMSALQASPVIMKAYTSCVAYALGDFVAQFIRQRSLQYVQMDRVARSATMGFLIHGPMCHYWIEFIEKYLAFNGAWWNFLPKMVADQTIWSFFLNSAYTTITMGLQQMPIKSILKEIKESWFTVLSAGWKLWPAVHCITFSPLISADLKLLFVDVIQVVWVVVLSTVLSKDKEEQRIECMIAEEADLIVQNPSLSYPEAIDMLIAEQLDQEVPLNSQHLETLPQSN